MKVTWIFLLAVGVVSADVSLGYHYNVPKTQFQLPSYQYGDSSGYASSLYKDSVGTGYQTGGATSGGATSASDVGTGFFASSTSSVLQPTVAYEKPVDIGSAFQTQYTSSSQYVAAQNNYQQTFQQQPTQVFKHFFVHTAPEEPEVVKTRAPIVLPPAQKHIKIIFVKTPTETHRSQITVPVQPQNEEKTIVYVLVKKPEEQHEVIVPKIEQKPPSKPEVYFIKYKNKEDSESVINNIVKDYNQGQQVTVLNTGLGDTSFNAVASAGDVVANAGVGEAAFSTTSSFGNAQFDTGAHIHDHGHSHSHEDISSDSQIFGPIGTQGSSFGVASANALSGDFDLGQISSSVAPTVGYSTVAPPVAYSTIAPPVAYSTVAPPVAFSTVAPTVYSSVAPTVYSSVAPTVYSSVVPTVYSTAASGADYDGVSTISTSQGVPHETYGIPKFRLN